MKEAGVIHKAAMELAEQAHLARLKGETDQAAELIRQAFEKEREAATLIAERRDMEPTRSVLHRSAASLALQCSEIREAERLISVALAGDPPEEIANELRDLLEQVYFQRHLDLRGVALEANEFQFSLTGDLVGFGMAESKHFITRVKDVETLIYRTAERKLEKPFRESGRRKQDLKEELELYLSVPRAASFAVSFKIGKSKQLKLPGVDIDLTEVVVDDLFDCLDMFVQSRIDELKERIEDPAYYRNFVSLARQIAPDGEKIRSVGFTSFKEGKERRVALSTPRARAPKGEPPPTTPSKFVEVTGTLLFADATKQRAGRIEVRDEDGRLHKIKVPSGMMADIVRPMFDADVVVKGWAEKDVITLEAIEPVEE